jgi:hypothetical protein
MAAVVAELAEEEAVAVGMTEAEERSSMNDH